MSSGARLGPYEVLSLLGAGGMGEVYRARDTKLNRDVALKILPESFIHDPERLARFRQEAQVLASLNHPHIGAIYGLDEANGQQFLVLELVDGETLAARLKRGALPLDKALAIAKQIAEALEAAHEKGIIHRDLKPANIALTKDGNVKVLDFGLAKATEATSGASLDFANSPTVTSPAMMTGVGIILGTAAYMSPEQAKGRAADKRSDVWAFGCVLFEMLTGKCAFEGEDVSDTLASVLKSQPRWDALSTNTPTPIRRLLRRCLDKDRTHRLADISDARLDLEEAATFPEPVSAAVGMGRATSAMWRWVALASVGALIAGGFIGWGLTRGARESSAIIRFSTDLTPAERLGAAQGPPRPPLTAIALSPGGRMLVFSGTRGATTQLFTRSFDQATAAPLAGTEGAIAPLFSPDGRWMAFVANDKLKKVPADGGPPIDICDVGLGQGRFMFGASWGSNDTIAFSNGTRILTVSASGGAPREIVKADRSDGVAGVSTPQWLPREIALLYTARSSADWTQASVVALPSNGGAPRTLITGAADARYVATGHLLYMKLGTLVAVPFDPARLQITGAPVALLDDVMQAANGGVAGAETGAGQFAVAPAGTLAYVTGGIVPDRSAQLVWVDRHGVETPLKQPPGSIIAPRISPDGLRLTYAIVKSGSHEFDIWVYDLTRDVATRLTFGGVGSTFPMWAPNGRHIIFSRPPAGRSGAEIQWIAPDGSGSPERVTAVPSPSSLLPASASSTGLLALVSGSEVWTLSLNGDRKPMRLLQGPFRVGWPAFSGDGRWLAYVSDESGRYEVYVQAYPGPGDKHRISRDGGMAPVWARNGRELFYRAQTKASSADTTMMAVDVDTTSRFRAGEPRVLFSDRYGRGTTPIRSYDVSADGQRFILAKSTPDPVNAVTSVHIVFNWVEELKARVPTR